MGRPKLFHFCRYFGYEFRESPGLGRRDPGEMYSSLFDSDVVERIRNQKLVGLRRAAMSPNDLVSRKWWETAFPGHPYAMPAAGTIETLPNITNADMKDYAARIFRIDSKARQQRIEELLELVGLADVAKRPIHGFSGGMKQRLGLAQALIHRPPVLILDEPMAGMDPAGRRDVIELLDGLRGQVTVFFSSHILADVDRVCDQIAILHEGELLLVADRAELLARYATNAIFLELAFESRSRQEALAARLQAESWVTGVLTENGGLRLVVTDTAVARQSLLPILVQQGVALNKYEWIRPSLEDVFLAISD